MKTYHPDAEVGPSFTDEHLSGPGAVYSRTYADALLTIPAEYRRPAMEEVAHRTSKLRWMDSAGGQKMSVIEIIPTGRDEHAAVIAEVRYQLGL